VHLNSFGRFASTVLSALLLVQAALATPVETLSWASLVPARVSDLEKRAATLQQQFMHLSAKTQEAYREVAHELVVRKRLASGLDTEGDLTVADLEVLQKNPSADNHEALRFWDDVEKLNAEMDAQQSAVEPSVNGRKVRIPGYVLPLELADAKVREFLLVPYVGACIHTPPPPANQMVYVKAPQGFESAGLYTPVWVEGTLSTHSNKYTVSFIDGNSAVDAGYSLEATKIERYGD